MTNADVDPHDDLEPMSFRQRTARILALLAILVIIAVWGFALFWPHRTIPGTMTDPTVAEAAQRVCTTTAAELAALPSARTTPLPAERADVLDRSAVLLTAMVDRLATLSPPSGSKDGTMYAEWLADWRVYIGDRAQFATSLRTDPTVRFYESEKDKQQISKPIDFFATANRMYDCVTPGDLA